MSSTMKLLGAMPPPGKPATIAELARAAGLERKPTVRAVDTLRRNGLAERVELGRYKLTAAGKLAREKGRPIKSGPKGPHTGRRKPNAKTTFRDRLWAALRLLKKASIPELIVIAGAGTARDPASGARLFLKRLERAGYVARLPKREAGSAPGSTGFLRWLLLKDTGPGTPRWSRARRDLYDPNLDAVAGKENADAARP